MRRIILLITVVSVMAAMMAISTLPAVALEPSSGPGQSSCIGHSASETATEFGVGFGGFISGLAGPGLGAFISGTAQIQPCPPH